MSDTVIRAIRRARAMYPQALTPEERFAGLYAGLEAARQAGDDGTATAHLLARALPRSRRAEAAIAASGSEWAGPVTDYTVRDLMAQETAAVTDAELRFTDAWATARAALARVPCPDGPDAAWRADAERVVYDALIPVPGPPRAPVVRIVPPAGAVTA